MLGNIVIMENKMETTTLYWGNIVIMENKMETIIVYLLPWRRSVLCDRICSCASWELSFSTRVGPYILGRPLGYLIFCLMALIGDPIYQYFSQGFRGQPGIA